MILLVTDTSGKSGFLGLVRADENAQAEQVKVLAEIPLAGGTFSAQLVPQIAALLSGQGLSKSNIGGFIVVSGPGSFTGLRVGLAAIKALAEILEKPIVPVSLLEVIAVASGTTGTTVKVLVVLDAGRGEVYAGEYEVSGESAKMHSEQLLTRAEAFSARSNSIPITVLTPDATLAEVARAAGLTVLQSDGITCDMVARLGVRKLQAGEIVSPEQLEANYGRRSDAEIFVKQT